MPAQPGDLIEVDGQEKLVLMVVGTDARMEDGTHVPAAEAVVTVPAYLVAAKRMADSKAAADAAIAAGAKALDETKAAAEAARVAAQAEQERLMALQNAHLAAALASMKAAV